MLHLIVNLKLPLNKNLKIAILIFANSSQEEERHKSIVQNGALFDALTTSTLKTVENSQLPYFYFTEKHQIGFTFRERFSNAIQSVFEIQFHSLFAITNLPIARFLDYLIASNNYEDYMYSLVEAYNPAAMENVMFTNTISMS